MKINHITSQVLRDALLGCFFGLVIGSMVGIFIGGVIYAVVDKTDKVLLSTKR